MVSNRPTKKILKFLIGGTFASVFLVYGYLFLNVWWDDVNYKSDRPLNKSIHSRSKQPHTLKFIDDGLASFVTRIDMIERAKESIELEYFIFELDLASQVITQKLIEKAKEGVKIRLLVDFALPVFKLAPIYGLFLKKSGIEVRYYNTAEPTSILKFQHRSHRKLMIIDGKEAITGGRNVGNDYFNLSEHYNFLDSDVVIEGETVKSVSRSFELYWDSEYAVSPSDSETSVEQVNSALDFLKPNEKLAAFLDEVSKYRTDIIASVRSFQCNDVEFVTDFPGSEAENRRVYQVLVNVLAEAKKTVLGESPYFIIRNEGIDLLAKLRDRGVKLTMLTNSLYSTDAYYTSSALYQTLEKLAELDMDLYAYGGAKPETGPTLGINLPDRWGVHSKRAVVDEKTVLIGTYNVDPRSANLNSELIIVCRDQPELAKYVRSNILGRIKNSAMLVNSGIVLFDNFFNDATFDQKTMFFLSFPVAWGFDFWL